MRYRILGVTTAVDEHGTVVPLGGPRLRALLTALALRPSRVTTPHTLIDEVWAEDPPQDAPAALQALVGRLRRALGKDAVTSEPGGYRLAAGEDDIDLHVFERLVQQGTDALTGNDPALAERHLDAALALWHGPALADLPDRSAATRPEARRLEATRARAEARIRLGRGRDVVPELRELTAVHPYDEPLHALLIRALREPAGTPTPSPRTKPPAAPWPTVSAPTPGPGCAPSTPNCSRPHRTASRRLLRRSASACDRGPSARG